MRAGVAVHGPCSALDRALASRNGPAPVAHFLNAVAPGEVLSAVRRCLPPDASDAVLHLVRAKLKPGRKLTAEYDVVLPSARLERRVHATWVAPGATAPGPADDGEAEARRRGVLAPFHRSWICSDDERVSLSVAPVDGAFPQLVRLHDPAHVIDVLRTTRLVAGSGDVTSRDVAIETVRYRPGQRHVLRVGVGASRPALFAKVYRDDTGRRAVAAAARAATAFAAAGGGAAAVSAGGGAYVAADRVAFWPEVPGMSLAEVIGLTGAAASDVVRTAGSALRLLHDAPSTEELPACPDAAAQAGETLRTGQLVDALVPALGSLLRRAVGQAVESLAALPAEPPSPTHGDVKCDNLLVSGSRVHLLDFDRSGRGDPAADIGKFLADLRWWTCGNGDAAARLREAFLDGYGGTEPPRMARARVYDGLFQLRMAARRVPIEAPDWEPRVEGAIGVAAAALAEETFP
jgi:aminoglycoside phosphotransferase (APT) family kinase protein